MVYSGNMDRSFVAYHPSFDLLFWFVLVRVLGSVRSVVLFLWFWFGFAVVGWRFGCVAPPWIQVLRSTALRGSRFWFPCLISASRSWFWFIERFDGFPAVPDSDPNSCPFCPRYCTVLYLLATRFLLPRCTRATSGAIAAFFPVPSVLGLPGSRFGWIILTLVRLPARPPLLVYVVTLWLVGRRAFAFDCLLRYCRVGVYRSATTLPLPRWPLR